MLLSCSFLLYCMLLLSECSSRCTESWKLLKMHSISTRADGIGTNLLDHTLAISVCDKLQLLNTYPHWVHRAGSKNCFKNICGSVYHDAMKAWLDNLRAHNSRTDNNTNQISKSSHGSGSRHPEELVTVCPPLPRNSAQKTIRGIMELQQVIQSM